MALWKSQKEDHTSGWLRAIPISRLGQTMNGKTYHCVLSYQLGIPLFSVLKPCSACSRVFAEHIYGDHVVLCAGIIGIKHHQNVVHDTRVDICFCSGILAGKEVDIGLDGGCNKPFCQAYMLLYLWDGGLDVCIDLSGFSPLAAVQNPNSSNNDSLNVKASLEDSSMVYATNDRVFDFIPTLNSVQGSKFQTHNIDDVAKLFGVPLNNVKDIDDFVQDLQLGKHEIWPLLSKEKGQEITYIVCNWYVTLNESASISKGAPVVDDNPSVKTSPNVPNADDNLVNKISPSDPIVQYVDINTISKSYVGAVGASTKDQLKVISNFHPLVADPVYDGVIISIPRKVVEKGSTRFEHTLYGYFIGKRLAFPVVEYYARNNWGKHGLKRIMMNKKGFFFFKFDSQAGLEAVLKGGPWMIRKSLIIFKKWSMGTSLLKEESTRIPIWVKLHDIPLQVFEEDGISLIATFIGKPVMLDSYTSSMCRDSWGRSSFARCLIQVNSEVDLVDDQFLKKVVCPPIVSTSNTVTPTVEKSNDCFQTVAKNVPNKGATNMGNASNSSSVLKNTSNFSNNDNITSSNSFSALNVKEEEEEEVVENVYDETAKLCLNIKTGGGSSFMAAIG
nr:hypothetical protein [Tanacetum cinerariifolium]